MTAGLRHALEAWRCLLARDPALLVFGFAIWSLLNGLSLALPGDAFAASPVYAVHRAFGLPEGACGAAMLANTAALLYALHPRTSATVRTGIGILTGAAWAMWGCLMVAGALRAGFFSSGGSWSAAAAFAVSCSTGSWIRHLPPAGTR